MVPPLAAGYVRDRTEVSITVHASRDQFLVSLLLYIEFFILSSRTKARTGGLSFKHR
jgi:hypothetical protein